MREIKFRGKETISGRWVYGGLLIKSDESPVQETNQEYIEAYITEQAFFANEHEVYVDSIGQYTGLKDGNGTEIYEGDIVKTDYGRLYEVLFIAGAFVGISSPPSFSSIEETKFLNGTKVVGNKYDNPELLSGE